MSNLLTCKTEGLNMLLLLIQLFYALISILDNPVNQVSYIYIFKFSVRK